MATTAMQIASRVYNQLWKWALPVLKTSKRVGDVFHPRAFAENLSRADVWIQAASAGEAHVCWSVLKKLAPPKPLHILLTANTRQGVALLQTAMNDVSQANHALRIACTYFPFDQPDIMRRAVAVVNPSLMILVELEIWPGIMLALKATNAKTIIINGRLSKRSLKRYLLIPRIWDALTPDHILATSPGDARRFQKLFQHASLRVVPNIKYDAIQRQELDQSAKNRMARFIPSHGPTVVLGAVRREEEHAVARIIAALRSAAPSAVIGLVPRHMHRIPHWENHLTRRGISWVKRSTLDTSAPEGTVIIWDVFGELFQAYNHFRAAFVGGSLVPLGGHNFLEPLCAGVVPVIGPYFRNFQWVGQPLARKGLLHIRRTWQTVARQLIRDMEHNPPREIIRKHFFDFIESRRGGADQTCETILSELAHLSQTRRRHP